MNNGNKRRAARRRRSSGGYRVRYDRIAAAVLVLIVLIVILTSCVKGCSKDKKSSGEGSKATTGTEAPTSQTIVDDLIANGDTRAIIASSTDGAQSVLQFTNESYSAADERRGDLVLVNDSHEYSFDSEDGDIVNLYENMNTDYYRYGDYVIKLQSHVIDKLDELMEAFCKDTGVDYLMIIGGYRTLADQNDRYNNGYSHFKGGFSDYHAAKTFDIGVFPTDGRSSGYYSPTEEYASFDDLSADYGFIVRFPDGKDDKTGEQARTYTYRYVGVPHASYIKQNDLCLEEYIAEVKTHNNTDPLEINVDGKLYAVYFAAASESGNSEVPVPSNKTYTVSGTNDGGFIVTVELN